jgi:hypothetical protein
VPALVLLLLASAPKIAAPGFTGVDIEDTEKQTYSGALADKLSARGAVILTPEDIDALLGKLKPDCPPALPGCMAQVGHALQADGVVSGTVRRSGNEITFDLQLLGRKAGLTHWSGSASSAEEALDAMTTAANVFGDALGLARARPKRSKLWWTPGVFGAGLLALGGLLAIPVANDASRLRTDPTLTLTQAQAVYIDGQRFEGAWIGCFAAAGIALAVSLVWLLVTQP